MDEEPKISVWMPWYVGDYRADTWGLTLEEHGAYLLLIGELWRKGGYVTFEPLHLARSLNVDLATWQRVWPAIERFFVIDGVAMTHKRVLRELEAAKNRRRRASDKGKKGAESRWNNAEQDACAMPQPSRENACAILKNGSSPSPSPSPERSELPADKPPPAVEVIADRRKSDRPPPSLFDRLAATYSELWQKRYGSPYLTTGADRTNFGRLLSGPAKVDPSLIDKLPEFWAAYLADRDPFLADKGHPLALFCAQVNKYRARAGMLNGTAAPPPSRYRDL